MNEEASTMNQNRVEIFKTIRRLEEGKVSVEEATLIGNFCTMAINQMREEVKGIALYSQLKEQDIEYKEALTEVRE